MGLEISCSKSANKLLVFQRTALAWWRPMVVVEKMTDRVVYDNRSRVCV